MSSTPYVKITREGIEVTQATSNLSNLVSRVDALEANTHENVILAVVDGRLIAVEANTAGNFSNVTLVNQSITDLRSNLVALEAESHAVVDLSTINAAISALETSNTSVGATLTAVNTAISNLQAANTITSGNVVAISASIVALEALNPTNAQVIDLGTDTDLSNLSVIETNTALASRVTVEYQSSLGVRINSLISDANVIAATPVESPYLHYSNALVNPVLSNHNPDGAALYSAVPGAYVGGATLQTGIAAFANAAIIANQALIDFYITETEPELTNNAAANVAATNAVTSNAVAETAALTTAGYLTAAAANCTVITGTLRSSDGKYTPMHNHVLIKDARGANHKFADGKQRTGTADVMLSPMPVVDSAPSDLDDKLVNTFSIAKGLMFILVAIMLDKKILPSLDSKLSSYFDDIPTVASGRLQVYGQDAMSAAAKQKARRDITVRDVLEDASGMLSQFGAFGLNPVAKKRMADANGQLDLIELSNAASIGQAYLAAVADIPSDDTFNAAIRGSYAYMLANTTPTHWVEPDVYTYSGYFGSGGQGVFGKLTPEVLTNTASHYTQSFFTTLAGAADSNLYLHSNPGDFAVYNVNPTLPTGVIEKIWEKSTTVANTYHEIVTQLILEPLGLTAGDYKQYLDASDVSNVIVDHYAAGSLPLSNVAGYIAGRMAASDFFPKYRNKVNADLEESFVQGGFTGFNADLPLNHGYIRTHYANGSVNEFSNIMVQGLSGATFAGANAVTTYATVGDYVASGLPFNSTVPDVSSNVTAAGGIKFFHATSDWHATPKNLVKILSTVSNKGVYTDGNGDEQVLFDPAVFMSLLDPDRKTPTNAYAQPNTGDMVGMYDKSIGLGKDYSSIRTGVSSYNITTGDATEHAVDTITDYKNLALGTGYNAAGFYSNISETVNPAVTAAPFSSLTAAYKNGRPAESDDLVIITAAFNGAIVAMNMTKNTTSYIGTNTAALPLYAIDEVSALLSKVNESIVPTSDQEIFDAPNLSAAGCIPVGLNDINLNTL